MEDFIGFEKEDSVPAEERPEKKFKHIRPVEFLTNSPWLKGEYSRNTTVRLHQEIVDFCAFMRPTVEEHNARKQLIRRLHSIVIDLWPEAELAVFGSFETRLYLPTSDIDLVVIYEKATLGKLAKRISRAKMSEAGTLKVISRASVPIVRFLDRETNFMVDICLNDNSGPEALPLVKELLEKHSALAPLAFVVKHFLKQRNLSQVFTGGIGSYSVLLLIASFLETHPFVQAKWIKEEDNLGVLLMDFLELYGKNFNFDDLGISLNGYFEKRDAEFDGKSSSMLCIKDPQNARNDMGRASFAMNSVRCAFEHAFYLLVATMADYSGGDASILSTIIAVPEKTLLHRRYIEQTTA